MGHAVQVDLFKGIRTFKRKVSAKAIEDAYRSGDYGAVLSSIPWDQMPDDIEDAINGVKDTTLAAADISIKKLPPQLNKSLRFDASNPQIRGFINNRTAALIKQAQDDSKESAQLVIRQAVTQSFTNALNPQQVAERIKGSIGLDPRRANAYGNFVSGLLEKKVPTREFFALTNNMQDRMLMSRAQTIARTEVRLATNFGQLSVWHESARQGLIDQNKAQKEWVVDGDPCETCEPMDGERVLIFESWLVEFPDGSSQAVDIPTEAHPNCMCGMEIVFNDEDEDVGEA
jgi:hypothetical protein